MRQPRHPSVFRRDIGHITGDGYASPRRHRGVTASPKSPHLRTHTRPFVQNLTTWPPRFSRTADHPSRVSACVTA